MLGRSATPHPLLEALRPPAPCPRLPLWLQSRRPAATAVGSRCREGGPPQRSARAPAAQSRSGRRAAAAHGARVSSPTHPQCRSPEGRAARARSPERPPPPPPLHAHRRPRRALRPARGWVPYRPQWLGWGGKCRRCCRHRRRRAEVRSRRRSCRRCCSSARCVPRPRRCCRRRLASAHHRERL
eukprot:359101-Chlamydomonas_euryale.AAC.2